LPPKIDALLSRGVNGIFLRGRLLIWRLQYRLTSLSVSGSGKSFDIVAKVNPSASVGHGIKMDRDELLQFLRDLADELIEKRDDVKSQSNAMLATQGTTTTSSGAVIPKVTVPAGTSIPAQVRAGEHLPELGRGQHREVAFEGTDGANIGTTRQVQSGHEGRQHQLIKELTESGLSAKAYKDIAKDAGVSGPLLAQAVIALQKGHPVPEGFSPSQVATLHHLMFSQEALRSRPAMLQAQMSLELLAKGTSPERVFGKTSSQGGLFPMSGEGAQSRARAVDEAVRSPQNVTRRGETDRKRQMRREVALVRAWVNSLDIDFKPGSSQREKVEQLKGEIRNRLLISFGLTPK
jgi:hypothetical protein